MSLPVGLPLVAVTGGPYNDYLGVPYSGTITVTPSTPVIWAATGAVLLNGSLTVTADAAGAFSFSLPATDASGLTVADFTYTISFALKSSSGEAKRILPIIIQLPEAAPTVDLDLLETLVSSTGISVGLPSVVSIAGLTGVVSTAALRTALGGVTTVVGAAGAVTGAQILADAAVAAALAGKASTSHASTHAAAGSDALTLTQAQITGLATALGLLAPLASPALTGSPTAPTASPGDNDTSIATSAFVTAAITAALTSLDGGSA